MQRKHWGGDFDHSAMKSEVSSLKVVNWRTWPITPQHSNFSKGRGTWSSHSASFWDFQFLEHFCGPIINRFTGIKWVDVNVPLCSSILIIYFIMFCLPVITNVVNIHCGFYVATKMKRIRKKATSL